MTAPHHFVFGERDLLQGQGKVQTGRRRNMNMKKSIGTALAVLIITSSGYLPRSAGEEGKT